MNNFIFENNFKRVPFIAIGPAIIGAGGQVTGAAMMFQLLVDVLTEHGWVVKMYNIAEKQQPSDARGIGGFSIQRMLDYIILIPMIWMGIFFSKRGVVYLITAQSKMGFLRDLFIISAAYLRGSYIICHQFGGHYGRFYKNQSKLIRFLIRKVLKRSSRIIVEGELAKGQLRFLSDYEERVCCVVNGLPERSLEVSKHPKLYNPESPFKMIYLSNMIKTKGYWDVLLALNILKKRKKNVICKFVGRFMSEADSMHTLDSGQEREHFFEFLKINNLLDYISYNEVLLGREKFEAFQDSHLFLLPSNYPFEGQPVSVLEAMAHGLVSITTNYSMIPLMVEDNYTGFFVPYGDPEAIATKIEYLMDNHKEYERLSSNSIHRFVEKFSTDIYVDRLMSVISEVVEQ